MTSKIIFIDTSFFKAIADSEDNFHKEASFLWEKYIDLKTVFMTSNFILDESYTVLRQKGSKQKAFVLRDFLISNSQEVKIQRVLANDEAKAWEWFAKDWSGLSFTDCVTFAQMKRLGITGIATFDQHFAKAGFEIVK